MRIIDRMVIDSVMEWTPSFTVGISESHTIAYVDKEGVTHRNFHPSTDLKDAMTVLYQVCEKNGWKAMIDTRPDWSEVSLQTKTGTDTGHWGTQKSLPLAICQTVLDSVGIRPEVLRD